MGSSVQNTGIFINLELAFIHGPIFTNFHRKAAELGVAISN